MIKLKQLRQQQAQGSTTTTPTTTTGGEGETSTRRKRPEGARVRLQRDIEYFDPPPGVELIFPDPDDLFHMKMKVTPSEGFYANATFTFSMEIMDGYPIDAPRVRCDTLIYHPNIDWDGRMCLSIETSEWLPVLSFGAFSMAFLTVLEEPSHEDGVMNADAAEALENDRQRFASDVRECLEGGFKFGRQFPKLL